MILSVSRRTDIPAYYFDWFQQRLKEGFLLVRNPMNPKQVSKINLSPDAIDMMIFWTKDPSRIIDRLSQLSDYEYYFQFTLNAYDVDLEPGLPNVNDRLISFEKLSKTIGAERVIWRYDPILISDRYNVEWHLEKFNYLAKRLIGMTDTVVISILDDYKKIRNQMKKVNYRTITERELVVLMTELRIISMLNGMNIQSCAEEINLSQFGIDVGKCVDDKRISKLLKCEVSPKKDKNQRLECGCIESVDIGAYNTCQHGCRYCYANFSPEIVMQNSKKHDQNSPLLIGNIELSDKIIERKAKSLCMKSCENLSFFDDLEIFSLKTQE